ncbi:hypothetical protein IQ264_30090 [Phormidium sp. LEGE 05292]|uniref:hypothetical protein n=1 Tax=[Phormidium] sp. LEGE 05292 TaxID=767427 RepID=UPI0018802CD3|nr:hypothetical protein [Phormidium sp. LEGE 05292]MBE9229659.1 hypothetical protein [Phormidium sp. LEGE 05292]
MGLSNIVRRIGQVSNPAQIVRSIDVPRATLIMGASAVGAFVGTKIGGPVGTAVGTLVGGYVGKLAIGEVQSLTVKVNGLGMVEIKYCLA